MTTNGFLLNAEAYHRFYSCGISDYQISLDGPPELHDTTRLQANGQGSFDTIWSNLLAIKQVEADGDILLRIHLTKRNVALISEFAERIRRTFDDDPRFRFNLQRVENLGGPNDLSELVIPVSRSRRDTGPSSLRSMRTSTRIYVCYAAKANSYVIRADGRIGKCTVALRSDNNSIGRSCRTAPWRSMRKSWPLGSRAGRHSRGRRSLARQRWCLSEAIAGWTFTPPIRRNEYLIRRPAEAWIGQLCGVLRQASERSDPEALSVVLNNLALVLFKAGMAMRPGFCAAPITTALLRLRNQRGTIAVQPWINEGRMLARYGNFAGARRRLLLGSMPEAIVVGNRTISPLDVGTWQFAAMSRWSTGSARAARRRT